MQQQTKLGGINFWRSDFLSISILSLCWNQAISMKLPYGHLSLKKHNVEFFLRWFFDINASFSDILLKTCYCPTMISTHFKFLTLGFDVSFYIGYTNVEFAVMHFQ